MPTISVREQQLWDEYIRAKRSGNNNLAMQKARELYNSLYPVIVKETNKYRYSGVPIISIQSEARQRFMEALDKFDPSFGASLSTFLHHQLRPINAFVRTYKDVARIPENRATEILNYESTKGELRVKLGREPNLQDIADAMNWDIREVRRMENELRKDLSLSGLQEQGLSLDFYEDSNLKETLDLVYMSLDRDEKLVMEYLVGAYFGKPKKKAKEIAKILGMSEAKVSRIRVKIADMIRQHR